MRSRKPQTEKHFRGGPPSVSGGPPRFFRRATAAPRAVAIAIAIAVAVAVVIFLAISTGIGFAIVGSIAAPDANAMPGAGSAAAQLPSAEELLARSIAYHDPDGTWVGGTHRVDLSSSRPDGSVRASTIVIDNTTGGFTLHRDLSDGAALEARIVGTQCTALVDGLTPTPEQESEANLDCTALQRTRNYHVYLYGLPMKLRDPGTILHPEASATTFQEQRVYALKVSYDPAVGSDTWYFYLDRETYALVGYRFYHDEAANDGEYITLEDEAVGGSVRLPKVRAWYMNADDRYLGTDTITAIVPLASR